MALIDLQNINKQYDIKVILKDVNFTLLQGQRIAVIGQNGHGKSTLFKIIMGQVLPDSGDIAIDKSIKIEMLDQSPKFEPNITVKEAISSQLKELKSAKTEYDELCNRLITEFENSELIRRHSELGTYLGLSQCLGFGQQSRSSNRQTTTQRVRRQKSKSSKRWRAKKGITCRAIA